MSIISLNTGTQAHFMAQGGDVQSSINLDKLSDVTVTNVADNQVLKYDASQSQWVNVATGAITSLDQLSDVVITNVQNNQSLQWNAATSKWINQDITANSIDGGFYP